MTGSELKFAFFPPNYILRDEKRNYNNLALFMTRNIDPPEESQGKWCDF